VISVNHLRLMVGVPLRSGPDINADSVPIGFRRPRNQRGQYTQDMSIVIEEQAQARDLYSQTYGQLAAKSRE